MELEEDEKDNFTHLIQLLSKYYSVKLKSKKYEGLVYLRH